MIKDMITDLKLAAMDMVGDVKDMVHDASTTLPDEGQVTFHNEAKQQNIQGGDMAYMGNPWATMPAQMTANRIDMIAEKINFVSEMIANGLIAFDSVEQELLAISRGTTPPTPAQLQGIASRIDANQKQVYQGLQKLRALSVEIDKATDTLQRGNVSTGASSGWGSNGIGGTGTGWY